jgi:hypothetical protein
MCLQASNEILVTNACDDQQSFTQLTQRTVRVFRQKFTPEDAIGSHACSFEARAGV